MYSKNLKNQITWLNSTNLQNTLETLRWFGPRLYQVAAPSETFGRDGREPTAAGGQKGALFGLRKAEVFLTKKVGWSTAFGGELYNHKHELHDCHFYSFLGFAENIKRHFNEKVQETHQEKCCFLKEFPANRHINVTHSTAVSHSKLKRCWLWHVYHV